MVNVLVTLLRYGRHLSKEDVNELVRPSEEAIETILSWISEVNIVSESTIQCINNDQETNSVDTFYCLPFSALFGCLERLYYGGASCNRSGTTY